MAVDIEMKEALTLPASGTVAGMGELDVSGLDPSILRLLMRISREALTSIFAVVITKCHMDVLLKNQAAGALEMQAKYDKANTISEKIEKLTADMDKDVTLNISAITVHSIIKIGIGVGFIAVGALLIAGAVAVAGCTFGLAAPLALLMGIAACACFAIGGVTIVGGIYDIAKVNALDAKAHRHCETEAEQREADEAKDELRHYGQRKDADGKYVEGWVGDCGFDGMPFYSYETDHFCTPSPDVKKLAVYQKDSSQNNNAASTNNTQMQQVSQMMVQQPAKLLEEIANLFRSVAIELFKQISSLGRG